MKRAWQWLLSAGKRVFDATRQALPAAIVLAFVATTAVMLRWAWIADAEDWKHFESYLARLVQLEPIAKLVWQRLPSVLASGSRRSA